MCITINNNNDTSVVLSTPNAVPILLSTEFQIIVIMDIPFKCLINDYCPHYIGIFSKLFIWNIFK